MEKESPIPNSRLTPVAALAGLAACAWLGWLALSQKLPAPPEQPRTRIAAPPEQPGAKLAAPPSLTPCVMDPDGYWRGRIFGSAALDIDWSGETLDCAGNVRPGDGGLRLFFAGHPDQGTDRLVLVIGIAAGVEELAGREHAASVTVIDEASSQFFHGADDRCFTRVRDVTPLPDQPDAWRVEGDLYCTGAIAAVSGASSVTLGDMAFAGRLTLDAEQ